jgi:hypothetical protein
MAGGALMVKPGLLSESLKELMKIRAFRRAGHECVKVVRHEAVRDDFNSTP